jgi:hypothetical protein
MRGLSGGERKRLSIAISLLSLPPQPLQEGALFTTLLLDEPTSGAFCYFVPTTFSPYLCQVYSVEYLFSFTQLHSRSTAAL